jgi:hypothetical protein
MVNVGDVVLYMPDACYHPKRRDDGRLIGGEYSRDRQPLWNRPWSAVVTAVHEDGSADLDIHYPDGGITFHYADRRHDPQKAPGTWHRDGE